MRLVCICGRTISFPSAKPGAKVRCPKCRARLRLPTEKEDSELIRWFCVCGQRLKARVKSSGREIRCPECDAVCKVPFVNKDDEFIDAKFLVDEAEIIEAEIIDDIGPEAPALEPGTEFDIDEDHLELVPLPHEKTTPGSAPARDDPIPLEGFEIGDDVEDANDESGPTASS